MNQTGSYNFIWASGISSFFSSSGLSGCPGFYFLTIQSKTKSYSYPILQKRSLKSFLRYPISGFSSNLRLRQQFRYMANSSGYPFVKASIEVDNFLSLIFSYFSFLVLAGRPCHGRLPLLKYIKTKPKDSRSSLLDYSKFMNIWILYQCRGECSQRRILQCL